MEHLGLMAFCFWGALVTGAHPPGSIPEERPTFQPKVLQNRTNDTSNDRSPSAGGVINRWPYLAAVLVSALIIATFIAMAVKCRLFPCNLDRYRHSLLPEGDTASQFSRDDIILPGQGMGGRGVGGGTHRGLDTDDDDGFIEDNYIQASERERAERHEDNSTEENEVYDSDDDIDFSIG